MGAGAVSVQLPDLVGGEKTRAGVGDIPMEPRGHLRTSYDQLGSRVVGALIGRIPLTAMLITSATRVTVVPLEGLSAGRVV